MKFKSDETRIQWLFIAFLESYCFYSVLFCYCYLSLLFEISPSFTFIIRIRRRQVSCFDFVKKKKRKKINTFLIKQFHYSLCEKTKEREREIPKKTKFIDLDRTQSNGGSQLNRGATLKNLRLPKFCLRWLGLWWTTLLANGMAQKLPDLMNSIKSLAARDQINDPTRPC